METVGPVLSGGIWGTGYNFGPPQRRYLWRHDSTDRWKMALWIQRRSKMRRMRMRKRRRRKRRRRRVQ